MNARRERMRPFHDRRVEMWVRYRDGIDATEAFDHRHGRVVKDSDAVPEDIALVRAHEQRALTDSECGRWKEASFPIACTR